MSATVSMIDRENTAKVGAATNTPTTVTPTTVPTFAALGARQRTLAALNRMGITTPTLIQARAIPPLLAGHDVIGQSRTGSGKTIAFGLPLIERLDPKVRRVQALVLVPTRELAAQVAGVLEQLDAGSGLRVAQLIGGRSLVPQREALMQGAQIAVGAPGRVLDHLRQGNLDLRALKVFVLDEADQMLDAGFAPDVERILSATPKERQMALFTATLPDWTIQIARKYLREPVRVDAGAPETRPAQTVAQRVYLVPDGQRLAALRALLDRRDTEGTTLVFGRTKHGVKKLAKQLGALGYPVAALQGNMSQNARDRVVADFRAGEVPIMLATNVAARGLDVLSIAQVINYELPESAELFTHRVGRTGRMDREGEAITLLSGEDMLTWRKMSRELGGRLQPRPWPTGEMPLPETPASALISQPTDFSPANGRGMRGGQGRGRNEGRNEGRGERRGEASSRQPGPRAPRASAPRSDAPRIVYSTEARPAENASRAEQYRAPRPAPRPERNDWRGNGENGTRRPRRRPMGGSR